MKIFEASKQILIEDLRRFYFRIYILYIFAIKKNMKRHEGPVWQVAWSHPMFGNYLASCSYDKKVIIWKEMNNSKWSPFYEYCGHESSGKVKISNKKKHL